MVFFAAPDIILDVEAEKKEPGASRADLREQRVSRNGNPTGWQSEVNQTHVAWTQTKGVPGVPSPLYYNGRLYTVQNGGIVFSRVAKTGELVYSGRTGAMGYYYSSPVAADNKIYLASEEGVVVVLDGGAELKVLAKNKLDGQILATPRSSTEKSTCEPRTPVRLRTLNDRYEITNDRDMPRIILFLAYCVCLPLGRAQSFDVVVYGGTAGGVIAAVSAAREGLRTALLEPGTHVGGMVSGGLSFTDFGKKEVIGGYALEFYQRVGRHYGMPGFGNDVAWYHEPHVAEAILREMLREAGVAVFEKHRLREKDGVTKSGAEVRAIRLENGATFAAKIFVDSSYEGDLMAQAGISYTYGREGSAQYSESLAGVRDRTPLHQFLVDVPARDAAGKLLPEISTRSLPAAGTADKAVQAYNYRMCFSDVPANRVAFPRPDGYDPRRYALFARLIETRMKAEGRVPALNTVIKPDRIPNGKADVNNNGAFSTDYIGGSWDYPDASYARRAEIWKEHKDYVAGFLYFLANDAQVPDALRRE
jgi:hypothetical protein